MRPQLIGNLIKWQCKKKLLVDRVGGIVGGTVGGTGKVLLAVT